MVQLRRYPHHTMTAPILGIAIAIIIISASFTANGSFLRSMTILPNASAQLQSMTWINVTRAPSPPTLAGDAMVFDAAQNKFFLFGGQSKYLTLNELWSYDPNSLLWSELHPASTSPLGRADPMFVWPSRALGGGMTDAAFLFGGWYNNSASMVGRLSDSWYYFPGNNTWNQVSPSGNPPGRSDSAVAYDSKDNIVLIYGGYNGTSYLSDIWSYYPQNATWLQVTPTSTSNPPPLADARMQYDVKNDVFVMFGGNNNLATAESYNHYNTTWTFNPSTRAWTLQLPSTSPPARDYAFFSYKPDSSIFMLNGGYGDDVALADTWLYSYTTNSWAQLHPATSPPARFAGAMDYATSANTLVLFGGTVNHRSLNDTWIFRYLPLTTVTISPPSTIHAGYNAQFSAMVTDIPAPVSSYLWLFGDGTNSTIISPIHTYTTNGTYEVRLTIIDVLNESFNSTLTLKVLPSTTGTVVITLFAAGVIGIVSFVVFLSLSAPKKKHE